MKTKIVLLGSLPKGDRAREVWDDWKQDFISVITKGLPDVEYVHGDTISDNAGAELVVGHDLSQVQSADICLIDAREKIGAGTAQEMVLAKYFGIPVVTVMPKNSHHRISNVQFHGVVMDEWVHPFLKVSSDHVADSIEDAADWIKKFLASPEDFSIKDFSVFIDAIKEFETYQKINNT